MASDIRVNVCQCLTNTTLPWKRKKEKAQACLSSTRNATVPLVIQAFRRYTRALVLSLRVSTMQNSTLTFSESENSDLWFQAYCLNPPNDSCDFGPCPNPDVTGIGQQISCSWSKPFPDICGDWHVLYQCIYPQLFWVWSKSVLWSPSHSSVGSCG